MSTEPTQEQEYAQAIKGKTGLKRILNACAYSKDGLQAAYEEQGFRQLIWLSLGLVVLLLCLDFGVNTKMILVFASFLILIVELFNTSIEAAVDHTSLARHPLAKRAKDTGSAAQTLALTLLAVLWLVALWRDYVATWF